MARRRKKWRAPNNPTLAAKQVWKAIYDEPWPRGWRVEWAGFMRGAYGLTLWSRQLILLSWGDARRGMLRPHHGHAGIIATLIHEFVHVRNPGLKHGKEFERLAEWGWSKLTAPHHTRNGE